MKAREQFNQAYGIRLSRRNHQRLLMLLLCLEIVLATSALGFIQLPPISMTTLSILVTVAAMYFGPMDGMIVSGVFAVASIWRATANSTEAGDIIFSPFLSGKPAESLIMAVGARLLFGLIAGLLFRRFFSKERKHRALGIAGIAVLTTAIHAGLIYACMAGFFGAAEVRTSVSFDRSLLISNLILYAATVLVVLGFDGLLRNNIIHRYFTITSAAETQITPLQKKVLNILTVVILLVCALVSAHFIIRLNSYIDTMDAVAGNAYAAWMVALMIQFVIGFGGVFGIIVLFFTGMQEFASAVAAEAGKDEQIRDELIQNNARIFALEDNFESLYDVEMESGRYLSYVKGDFYQENVIEKLVSPTDYFDDLRANIDAVIWPEDRDGLYNALTRDAIRRNLAEADRFEYLYRVITDKGPVWFKMRVVWKDTEKKNVIIGVFNAENDVDVRQLTEQKRQLEESLAFTNFFLGTYNSAYYADLDTLEVQVQKSADPTGTKEMTLNAYDNSMIGFLKNAVHPDDLKGLLALLQPGRLREILREQESIAYTFRDISQGTERLMRMQVIRGADEHHAAVGFQDITEENRRQQEQQKQLADALEAAEAANQSKSNFLFNMSHDIRTPMNAIRGFTAMARKHADEPEQVTRYLEKIDISGQQLLTLINQVLEMARIESGRTELNEKTVSIREEFTSMVTVLSEQASVNGLTFISSLTDIEHDRVFADEARMSSITLNIAGNAMKYTPEGGRIEFLMKEIPARKPEYATYVFTVKDTGIGMSKEYLQELYEPFSREKNTTVSRIQGTGLGLSIVKSIVDLMGGKIEVWSEPGQGSRFDVTVDLRIAGESEENGEAQEPVGTFSFAGRRVLLVEDNEMNREIAKDILTEQGILVDEAEDGDIAVEKIRACIDRDEPRYYDFVLMDIQMPRMNGYEATAAIRRDLEPYKVHLPIIAMTANAFEEDRRNALAAGMDEHLAKPIDVQLLFRTIMKLL